MTLPKHNIPPFLNKKRLSLISNAGISLQVIIFQYKLQQITPKHITLHDKATTIHQEDNKITKSSNYEHIKRGK